jgi:hypothetical protein
MLLCSTREWPARDLISTDEHQDYLVVHKEHSDWVSQVRARRRVLLFSGRVICFAYMQKQKCYVS